MKKNQVHLSSSILCLILLLQPAFSSAVSVPDKQLPDGVISPEKGSICNEQENVCYDTYGVSIGITKDVFGQQAADKLTSELSKVDGKFLDRNNFNPVRGVSCHTLEKACYKGNTIHEALSEALFAGDVEKYDSHALLDIPWAWDKSLYNNDTEVVAEEGRDYLLTFQADGSLKIMADCNRVFGKYQADGKILSITLGPSTRMACAPGSQDQQFLRDLEGAAGWFFKKGDLYLDMKFDTGTMHFYKGIIK